VGAGALEADHITVGGESSAAGVGGPLGLLGPLAHTNVAAVRGQWWALALISLIYAEDVLAGLHCISLQ